MFWQGVASTVAIAAALLALRLRLRGGAVRLGLTVFARVRGLALCELRTHDRARCADDELLLLAHELRWRTGCRPWLVPMVA